MVETPSSIATESTTAKSPETNQAAVGKRVDGIVVWTLISMVSLVYIAFGTVDARIWRFGQLRVESKSLKGIWSYEADNLPQVSHQWILTTVFVTAIAVFVIGVLAAIWLLLDSGDDDVSLAGSYASASQPNGDTVKTQSGK